ncbi:MAG: iron-containing alcohol dehydrogenase [Verrucomicrobiae bacterium]|nr:iron-containing alcohol dehydrogenase [Verrucomicrobiae bacterium]
MAASPASASSEGHRRLPPDWHLAPFDKQPRTRLVFGRASVARIGEFVGEMGGRRVLVVTDPGLVRAGHPARICDLLRRAGAEVEVFDQVRENPDTVCVDECLAVARVFRPEVLVGLGGGSAMDTAKGCNFLHTNGGRMQDYWGVGKARRPMLPFVAIPTTAGTGSECQSAALIADADSHMKMACLDPKAAARIAILDPELTVSQPRAVTAHTGIDAIAHAVETAVTARRNAISLMYSHEAFKLLVPSLPKVLRAPDDVEARGRMLLGAALAGTAIELSMLGAAHSAANPLTAHFGVVHGVAVGLMLPHVVRFNAADPDVRLAYAELASAPEIACVSEGIGEAVEALVRRLEGLLNLAETPGSLGAAGVDGALIPKMAEEAARQWTANFNPRPLGREEFAAMYRAAEQPRGGGELGEDEEEGQGQGR